MKKVICLMLIIAVSLSCCGCEFNPLKLIFDNDGQTEKVDDEIIEPIMPNPDYLLKRETMYTKTPRGYEKNNAREYTYNKDGYLAGVIVTNFGSADAENEGTYNDYDANGNPKSLTFEDNDYTLYDYNDDGTMKEKTVYEDGSNVLTEKYRYDEYGKKIKHFVISFDNEPSMDVLTYKYESDKIVYGYIYGDDAPVTKIVSEYDNKNNKVKDILYTRTDDEKELSEDGYIVYEYILKADVISKVKVAVEEPVIETKVDKEEPKTYDVNKEAPKTYDVNKEAPKTDDVNEDITTSTPQDNIQSEPIRVTTEEFEDLVDTFNNPQSEEQKETARKKLEAVLKNME